MTGSMNPFQEDVSCGFPMTNRLLSALSSDCTKSLVTVRSHSTVPAALALSLGAPAGPSRSAGARRSGPIYSDRPAGSARSKLRVRRTATGVGRRWRRARAHNPPRHLFVRPWRYPPRGSQSHASRTRRASRSTPSTSAGIARTACTATAISASDPDGEPSYAICNPNTGRACFAKHVSKVAPTHTAQFHGPRQPTHTMIRESPLRQRARTGANAPAPASATRSRLPRRL